MSGRAILVTGGAAGIGWATAQRFAAAGDRVMIADIDGARAETRARDLGAVHRAVQTDLSDPAAVVSMIAACVTAFGRLDVLVNNAGRIDSSGTSIVDQPTDAFLSLIALNLDGTVCAATEAARVMTAQGGGAIVNVASGAALRAIPLRNAYSASKAGVVAATRTLARQMAPHNIQVNAIAPGYTRTELVDTLIRNGRVDPIKAVQRIPLGRMGRPEEMADAIFHLASPSSRAFVGGLLLVDGGGQAYGGSEAAGVPRGATPTAPPTGAPLVVISSADDRIPHALQCSLATRAARLVRLDQSVDLADRDAVAQAIRAIVSTAGRLDALVTVAPSIGARADDRARPPHEDLIALFHLSQAAGRQMLRQGYGSVCAVTATSDPGGPSAGMGSAEAAAAMAMFTKSMACEWGGSGVRANTVAVGRIDHHDRPVGADALPYPITASDIAVQVDFLISPAASYVSGTIISLDGGLGLSAGSDG